GVGVAEEQCTRVRIENTRRYEARSSSKDPLVNVLHHKDIEARVAEIAWHSVMEHDGGGGEEEEYHAHRGEDAGRGNSQAHGVSNAGPGREHCWRYPARPASWYSASMLTHQGSNRPCPRAVRAASKPVAMA